MLYNGTDLLSSFPFALRVDEDVYNENGIIATPKYHILDEALSDIDNKADKTELHSHTNKTVIDGILSSDITNWNNKSDFSGSYNDLTDKPTIPTYTKQDIGLGNVDNTSDINKPVSIAQQEALNAKSPLAGSSSLTICSQGTFGDMATKTASNYQLVSEKNYSGGYAGYEEGKFVNSLICYSDSSNTQITEQKSSATARYKRVGNMCYINVTFAFIAPQKLYSISGLPFNVYVNEMTTTDVIATQGGNAQQTVCRADCSPIGDKLIVNFTSASTYYYIAGWYEIG